VTTRAQVLAPARAWLRRALPAGCAALALLGIGAGWLVAATGPAQPDTGRAAGASLLDISAGRMLPAPIASASPPPSGPQTASLAPLGKLLTADVLVVSDTSLPAASDAAVRRVHDVTAAGLVDAARVQVNGKYVAMLGVDPATFRAFTERPTAASSALWQSVANGGIAVSYTMGSQDKLPVGGTVRVAGQKVESLRVGGLGTVGIGGVDAVVSTTVARSLGFPVGNALVVSAPHATVASLIAQIKAVVPKGTLVEPLVASTTARPGTAGEATAPASVSDTGLTSSQATAMLEAAVSRLGMPYVWGAAGPTSFDCSGLVQWSFAQAGMVMPRVAADQALTGPAVPFSQAQPGDLLFYHTDPTAPDYISHVAIYLGKGWMIQAPEPGENVQVVPVALGSEFAGVVRVSPRIAAAVAADPVS
jgi:cell wall-associated NlpC family hydrolase